MENIKFIPHFACLHGQKLKTQKLSYRKHQFRFKTRSWSGLFCMQIRLLFSCCQRPVFSSYHVALLWACYNNHHNIPLFEEQPLLQLSIFKLINLMVKRTSASIKGQALFRKFIKPTMSLGVSFHNLSQHHAILLLKHLLLALYKLIQIGVEIQSQLRSMVLHLLIVQ